MENIQIYYYLWFFAIYSFIGWCSEVVYAVITTGKFSNRGFLNGPVCPIYGFGTIIVILSLTPFRGNLLLLFTGSVLLTSILELATGFLLEKVFHNKWWDYSDKPFNIGGYICLSFSLMWGLGCIFVIHIIHPMISYGVFSMPKLIGGGLIALILLLLALDTASTVVSVYGFNKRLHQLDEIAAKIKNISEELGENLTKNTLAIMEINDDVKEELGERKAEFEELITRQRELLSRSNYVHHRLVKAFPGLKSNKFAEALEKLKQVRS